MSATQSAAILAYLKTGKSLTPLDALEAFQCFRLAARVHDLRGEGWPIVKSEGEQAGKRFAVYSLDMDRAKWPKVAA